MNGVIIQYWTINPGGIPQFSYKPITGVDRFNVLSMKECSSIPQFSCEPITGVDRFNVLSMKECSSADWNLKDTSAWGESAHCTNGM